MNCDVIKDLIPLYIDGCCSDESEKIVKEHIENCASCKQLFDEMNAPTDIISTAEAPTTLKRIKDWKASVLQSVLLFVSFGLITIGVACESSTTYDDLRNGLFAMNLVVPATGFMLSLANWYFVRVYKSRKSFSNYSLIATLGVTLCAYIWSGFHYEMNLIDLFAGNDFANVLETLHALLLLNGIGILLTVVFCTLSKTLSYQYAKMLGKE